MKQISEKQMNDGEKCNLCLISRILGVDLSVGEHKHNSYQSLVLDIIIRSSITYS